MKEKTAAEVVRENALVEAASTLYPALELECKGRRAVCIGGHEDDIDSINVIADGKVVLISEWVLEHCLKLPGGTTNNDVEDRRLTLTKPYVVAYANQHVAKTPLLQWCREMCMVHGVQDLQQGSSLLVFWWDMEHGQQENSHMCGRTWWPAVYTPKYDKYGVWYSARVQKYNPEQATLHVKYDYNAPDELERGKVILPLNFVHFGDTPPPAGGVAQVFPPPWKPPGLVPSQQRQQQQQVRMKQHKGEACVQGKPAATQQQQQQHMEVLDEKQNQLRQQTRSQQLPSATSSRQPQQLHPQQRQQDLFPDGRGLLSSPPKAQQDVCTDSPKLQLPSARQTMPSPQHRKSESILPKSQPTLQGMVASAGLPAAQVVQSMVAGGSRPSSICGTSSLAPKQQPGVRATTSQPDRVAAMKPSGPCPGATGSTSSSKRGTWALDNDLEKRDERACQGDDGTKSTKRHKGSKSQASPSPSVQPTAGRPAQRDQPLTSAQQAPNILGMPPKPPKRPKVTGSVSPSTEQGATNKGKHMGTDKSKQQPSGGGMVPMSAGSGGRPAAVTTAAAAPEPPGGSMGQQQPLEKPPVSVAAAAAAASAAHVPSGKGRAEGASKTGIVAGATDVHVPAGSQAATNSGGNRRVAPGLPQQQQKHRAPSPSRKAEQQQQQRSSPQQLPQSSNGEKQRQPKQQKREQRSANPQRSAGSTEAAKEARGPAAAAAGQRPPSTSSSGAGGSKHTAVKEGKRMEGKSTSTPAGVSSSGRRDTVAAPLGPPGDAGAAAAGASRPVPPQQAAVGLAVGPTSRVMWPRNKQQAGTALSADDLLARPPAVHRIALLSEENITTFAASRGLGGSSTAEILRRQLPLPPRNDGGSTEQRFQRVNQGHTKSSEAAWNRAHAT
ncbi:hypothetical protein PLESTM_002006000 [Pleodorina starrii]|nr:hypothetical protein PLESTM_002006000 [Pleodorina starrii]